MVGSNVKGIRPKRGPRESHWREAYSARPGGLNKYLCALAQVPGGRSHYCLLVDHEFATRSDRGPDVLFTDERNWRTFLGSGRRRNGPFRAARGSRCPGVGRFLWAEAARAE